MHTHYHITIMHLNINKALFDNIPQKGCSMETLLHIFSYMIPAQYITANYPYYTTEHICPTF